MTVYIIGIPMFRSEVTHEEVCETQRLEVQASKKGKQKKMKKKTPDAPMMITEDPSGKFTIMNICVMYHLYYHSIHHNI